MWLFSGRGLVVCEPYSLWGPSYFLFKLRRYYIWNSNLKPINKTQALTSTTPMLMKVIINWIGSQQAASPVEGSPGYNVTNGSKFYIQLDFGFAADYKWDPWATKTSEMLQKKENTKNFLLHSYFYPLQWHIYETILPAIFLHNI